MKCDEVKEYYDILSKKKFSLKMKRAFDLVAGTGVLIVTALPIWSALATIVRNL